MSAARLARHVAEQLSGSADRDTPPSGDSEPSADLGPPSLAAPADPFQGAIFSWATTDFHLAPEWPTVWSRIQDGRAPFPILGDQGPFDGLVLTDFPGLALPDTVPLWYADHHPDPYTLSGQGPALAQAYAGRRARGETNVIRAASSCARLLEETLPPVADPIARAALQDAAAWADCSDRAGYKGWDPVRDPLLALDMLLPVLESEGAAWAMAELAWGRSLPEVLLRPYADRLLDVRARAVRVTHSLMSRQTRVGTSGAVFTPGDTEGISARLLKFASFTPGVEYTLVFERSSLGPDAVLWRGALSRSPNAGPLPPDRAHPDLGRVVTAVGAEGGGHPYAAGLRLRGTTDADCARQLQALLPRLGPLLQALPLDHPLAEAPPPRAHVAPAREALRA